MPTTATPHHLNGLRILSPEQAHKDGFASITTDICAESEKNILASICLHRKPDRAILIHTGPTSYQLAIPREHIRGGE